MLFFAIGVPLHRRAIRSTKLILNVKRPIRGYAVCDYSCRHVSFACERSVPAEKNQRDTAHGPEENLESDPHPACSQRPLPSIGMIHCGIGREKPNEDLVCLVTRSLGYFWIEGDSTGTPASGDSHRSKDLLHSTAKRLLGLILGQLPD